MDGVARYPTSEGIEVLSLVDGIGTEPVDWFVGLGPDAISVRLGRPLVVQFNAFVVRLQNRNILVDTGHGPFAGAERSHLADRLAELGIYSDDVDTVVFTHLHTDHCGGALVDGAPVFRNADVVMHRDEAAYWRDRDHQAARVIAAYSDKLTLAVDGHAIAPGISLWHLPGHTPGHSGLQIGDGCAIVGDLFHAGALQFADPEIVSRYDVDPALAYQTRRAAFRKIAETGLVIGGSHAVTPLQFCRLVADEAGYLPLAP